jgi:site-specific recombinase XerD
MDESSGGRSERRARRPERGVFERPLGSGIWWVRYVDDQGRLHREKVGPKALALKVYHKRRTEIQERRFFPERLRRREALVGDTIDDYLTTIKDRLHSYRDRLRYASLWKSALAGKTLRQVVPGDVERYIGKRVAEVSPATVNRELAFLKRVFQVAIGDGYADINPVRAVKMFKENNKRVRFLSETEEERLHAQLSQSDWSLVEFALQTGLRQAEQFHLRWENIDFPSRTVTVTRSKSGELRRVRMNDTVTRLLRDLAAYARGPWVFPSRTRETSRDSQNFLHRSFLPALKRAGIENFRWHDLRHTFASRLVMAGVDLRTVQELMGHHSIEMTLRYAHLSPEHQLDAVRRLDHWKPTDTSTDTRGFDGPEGPKGPVLSVRFYEGKGGAP